MTKKVVILGSGFGGFRLAKDLDHSFHVTLVSPRNYFLFTPLLASTTVGTIEFRSIIEPVRVVRRDLHFYQASCHAVDHDAKQVHCLHERGSGSFLLPYDYLAIAVGAKNNTYRVPGVEEYCVFLKDLPDARAIRQRIIDTLEHAATPGLSAEERARLLQILVIGGGPTGIEFAAELSDFINEDLQQWFPNLAQKATIIVLEASSTILSTFDERLREYTLKRFKRLNIEVRLASPVKEIQAGSAVLVDGTAVPFGLAVWSAGTTPSDLIAALRGSFDPRGRVKTTEFLEVIGMPSVFALGDCATVEGKNYPATAQVAEQQGKFLAKHLLRLEQNAKVKPFIFSDFGMLAYIGHRRAIADLPGVSGKGFWTWIFWRSVYLTKIVSFKNRVLVLFDWAKAAIFGRDISRF